MIDVIIELKVSEKRIAEGFKRLHQKLLQLSHAGQRGASAGLAYRQVLNDRDFALSLWRDQRHRNWKARKQRIATRRHHRNYSRKWR